MSLCHKNGYVTSGVLRPTPTPTLSHTHTHTHTHTYTHTHQPTLRVKGAIARVPYMRSVIRNKGSNPAPSGMCICAVRACRRKCACVHSTCLTLPVCKRSTPYDSSFNKPKKGVRRTLAAISARCLIKAREN